MSSDHGPEEMMSYMREAHGPWLRLDYREREAQQVSSPSPSPIIVSLSNRFSLSPPLTPPL